MSYANKEKYGDRFKKNGCTITQLKKLVKIGALTAEEYKEITGEVIADE